MSKTQGICLYYSKSKDLIVMQVRRSYYLEPGNVGSFLIEQGARGSARVRVESLSKKVGSLCRKKVWRGGRI